MIGAGKTWTVGASPCGLSPGYIAVVALMRLMAHKRNEVAAEVRGELEKENSRR